eukprot:7324077-Pyramimonas_sp.AAC.1
MRERSLALHLARMSPSRSAAAWNAHLISLAPYAAHYAPPDVTQERELCAQLRTALGLAGASWVPDI